ncbi:MAG: hypothetical protein FJ144_23415, partial [Deltaproteobacteria bacterium]|nr:hypothetical protein [Deltaproteobacteria bacterium]
MGRRGRSGTDGSVASRELPGWRRAGGERRALARLRGARLRGVPRVLLRGPAGSVLARVRDPSEPGRRARAPADARRGALRARIVRRDAERTGARGAMTGRRAWLRFGGACAAVLAAGLLAAVRLGSSLLEVPTPREVRAAHRPSDARLLDRDGAVLHEVRIDEKRRALEWTPLERISPALVAAVLHSEDRRFRSHQGVDGRAIVAAALGRVTGETRRGASTITMQLAALLDPSLLPGRGGRTLGEKVRQILAALALERSWSKEEVLEAYLNLVPVRGDVVGVAAASSALLGKDPHGVSHAEALVLASLLRSPGTTRARALERSAALARAMHEPVD